MSERSNHPTPWGRGRYGVWDADGEYVMALKKGAAGDRALACVNACAGLPTEALESGSMTKALDALRWLVSGAADARETTQARLDGIEALKALGMAP